jgi:hypothetical protein
MGRFFDCGRPDERTGRKKGQEGGGMSRGELKVRWMNRSHAG